MNTTNTTPTPTVGRPTAELLAALRSVENARAHLYEYHDVLFGEETAEKLAEEYAPILDAARDYVEKLLADGLRTWANMTDPDAKL